MYSSDNTHEFFLFMYFSLDNKQKEVDKKIFISINPRHILFPFTQKQREKLWLFSDMILFHMSIMIHTWSGTWNQGQQIVFILSV